MGTHPTRRSQLRSSWLRLCTVVSLGSLASCSFGDDDQASMELNSCTVDSDCASQDCQAGRCVAVGETAIKVSLVVTPKRMPDGSQPLPIVAAPFSLEAGEQTFALERPVSVPVKVLSGGQPIAAQVRFTPREQENPLTSKSVMLNTVVPTAGQPEPINNVMLLGDAEYDVVVQPTNADLAVRNQRFKPSEAQELTVDYELINWQTRLFLVVNGPHDSYTLRARAREADGGILISNSAAVKDTALANLRFDPGAFGTNYDLELAPAQVALLASGSASTCGGGTPPSPTITYSSSALKHDKSLLEVWVLDLPTLPAAVDYQAQITLCPNQQYAGDVQVALTSTALYFESENRSVTGHYETTTTASWDPSSSTYNFCTSLPPGDYTVKVTPPANVSCEMFAERRLIRQATGTDSTPADTLNLRSPATLSGRVVSPDMAPIANASIDLVALQQSSIVLAPDDPTVPLFNRSRQVTTASGGAFSLPVDLGSYDFTVKPPALSNYAWRIFYGVDVGSRGPEFSTVVSLSAPVVVTGQLNYVDGDAHDQSSLALADVAAFTLVDKDTPSARSVEIARGQADAQGNVTLLMPPQLQKSWNP